MKSIKYPILLLLCTGIFIFCSCQKSSPPQLEAIPANASFVVVLENMKMVKKGGLDHLKESFIYQKMKEQSSSEDPVIQDFMNKFIENPKSLGLDLEQTYIYGFEQADRSYTGIVFKMDNLSSFDGKIKELLQSENTSGIEIEDKGQYKLINQEESGNACVWNQNLFIIFSGNVKGLDYGNLLSLPKDKNILSVQDFVAFQDRNCDIGCWVPYTYMAEFYKQMTKVQLPAFMKDVEGTYLHAYVHFENGEIKASGKLSPQSNVDEFLAKYPVMKKDFNNNLLEDFPETSYMSAKVAVNWMEYLKLMNEAAGSMGDPTIQGILKDPSAQKIFNVLDGDMLLSIYGFAQGPLPLPLMGISFSVKDKADFDQLLSVFPPGAAQKSGDYYHINFGMGITVYMAHKDKRVLFTDDVESITAFTGKGYGKSLKSNEFAKNHQKDPCMFYINLDLDTYPENIRALLNKEGPRELQNALKLLSPYKDMSYSVNDKNEVVFSLKFKDSSQNSLKLLLKNAEDIAKVQMQ